MSEGSLVVSVTEAAELLGISRGLAYELARGGQLPSLRLGRRLVVPRAALLMWLERATPPESREGAKGAVVTSAGCYQLSEMVLDVVYRGGHDNLSTERLMGSRRLTAAARRRLVRSNRRNLLHNAPARHKL